MEHQLQFVSFSGKKIKRKKSLAYITHTHTHPGRAVSVTEKYLDLIATQRDVDVVVVAQLATLTKQCSANLEFN